MLAVVLFSLIAGAAEEGMNMLFYLYILLASGIGGFIQTTLGFGYGIFVMAVFPFFIASIPKAAALSAIVSLICALMIFVRMYRHVRIKGMLLPMLIYFLLMPVCSEMSLKIPAEGLKILLGIVMIFLAGIYILGFEKISMPANTFGAVMAGVLCSVLGGFFAVGGPPMVIYCLSMIKEKDEYVATMQAFFIIINTYGTFIRIMNGIVDKSMIGWVLAGAAGLLLGVGLGKRVYEKIELNALKKWIYGFIGVNGLWIIFSTAFLK